MSHEENARAIAQWQETMEELDDQQNKLADLFRCAFDAPLFEAIANLQSKYTKAVSKNVGDQWDWLLWYWLDNDMGRGVLNAVIDGEQKHCRTPGELAAVIELHAAYEGT